MTGELSTALIVEILATAANLVFIVLLIREKILCWPFGIVGSLLSIYLFVDARLYSEAVLYLFYALMGGWGWLRWRTGSVWPPLLAHAGAVLGYMLVARPYLGF